MDRQKKNWLIAAIAIIIIIALLYAWFSSRAENGAGATGNQEGQSQESQSQESQSQESSLASGGGQDEESPSNLELYVKEQDEIMSRMMDGMHGVEKTGNASIHFLKGMIPHHESAVEMAESYLKHGGQDERLKKVAEDIIEAQKGEIRQMDGMIKRLEESGQQDEAKEGQYLQEYDKMMASHHQTGHSDHDAFTDVEQAFAEGMIMHHQMAVEMAEAILKFSDDEEVRSLSQTIIDTQEMEIQQMQDILNGMGQTQQGAADGGHSGH